MNKNRDLDPRNPTNLSILAIEALHSDAKLSERRRRLRYQQRQNGVFSREPERRAQMDANDRKLPAKSCYSKNNECEDNLDSVQHAPRVSKSFSSSRSSSPLLSSDDDSAFAVATDMYQTARECLLDDERQTHVLLSKLDIVDTTLPEARSSRCATLENPRYSNTRRYSVARDRAIQRELDAVRRLIRPFHLSSPRSTMGKKPSSRDPLEDSKPSAKLSTNNEETFLSTPVQRHKESLTSSFLGKGAQENQDIDSNQSPTGVTEAFAHEVYAALASENSASKNLKKKERIRLSRHKA